jgi:A/G-specific adenine glycosylase
MQEHIRTEDDADDATVTFKVMTPALLALTARFGEVEIRRELPVIEHVFTHFKLHIHTVVAELAQHAPQVADANYVWLDLKQAADAGLPAPIKTLLNSLAQAELQL